MRVSSKNSVQGRKVLEISKSIEAKQRNNNHTESDDPQIPQPDLRLASGKSEAKSRKTPKHKNRARAQTKTPTESICTWKQWKIHCIPIKNMQDEHVKHAIETTSHKQQPQQHTALKAVQNLLADLETTN